MWEYIEFEPSDALSTPDDDDDDVPF